MTPLDELHEEAARMGAVIALTSTHDSRLPGGGKRINSSVVGAALRSLVVVRPHPDAVGRWAQLSHGVIIAVATLAPPITIDVAATALVDAIQKARQDA